MPAALDDVALAVQLARVDHQFPVRACVNAAGGSYRFGRLEDAERFVAVGLEYAEGGRVHRRRLSARADPSRGSA